MRLDVLIIFLYAAGTRMFINVHLIMPFNIENKKENPVVF